MDRDIGDIQSVVAQSITVASRPSVIAGFARENEECPVARIAMSSESVVILLYKNKVPDIIAIGKMTSKKRGRASPVRIQKLLLDEPAFITISKNFRDCVRKIIKVRTKVMNTVAKVRFFNM